jgi:amidohydrolase
MEIKNQIKQKAQQHFSSVVAIRRHLHQNPELSKQEKETSKYICSILDTIDGVEYQSNIGGYGIFGFIKGRKPNKKTIALRADIDALPIKESTNLPFASLKEGVMHACGHDAHTAILLGAIKILSELREEFDGQVMFIFQPSEEHYPGGAITMLNDGIFNNITPKAIFALHTTPEIERGKIGIKEGKYMASTDEIYIEVRGKGGHGATPDLNIDPIVAASHIVIALQTLVSRNANPTLPTTFSVGTFLAEGRTNIIPSKVYLECIIRTFDNDWRKQAHKLIHRISEETAQAFGATADVFIDHGYPYLYNNPTLTKATRNLAQEYLGEENVLDIDMRMTAEDFAYFAQKIPACYFRLGTKKEGCEITNLHTSNFDIDENSMQDAIGLMTYLAIENLNLD